MLAYTYTLHIAFTKYPFYYIALLHCYRINMTHWDIFLYIFFFSINKWCCNTGLKCFLGFLMAQTHLCCNIYLLYIKTLLHQLYNFWQVAVTLYIIVFTLFTSVKYPFLRVLFTTLTGVHFHNTYKTIDKLLTVWYYGVVKQGTLTSRKPLKHNIHDLINTVRVSILNNGVHTSI